MWWWARSTMLMLSSWTKPSRWISRNVSAGVAARDVESRRPCACRRSVRAASRGMVSKVRDIGREGTRLSPPSRGRTLLGEQDRHGPRRVVARHDVGLLVAVKVADGDVVGLLVGADGHRGGLRELPLAVAERDHNVAPRGAP